jgi:nucleotide-binding universal stress UspA family protein
MKRVIAALDDTEAAAPVAQFARQLARVLGAEVDALHVRSDGSDRARAAANAVRAQLRTMEGEPAPDLLREANRDDVVAVVLGRSHEAAEEPIGPVAAELLTALPKPVAVVPRDAVRPGRLANVLVPLEGTRSTSLAPRRTIELARDAGVDILLLHVFDEASVPAVTDQPQHEAAAWAGEFLARYSPSPPEALRLEVRVGAPEEHVLAVAREADTDLIALGWSRELGHGRAPIVRTVLEDAKLPVLLIPVVTVEAVAAEGLHTDDQAHTVSVGAATHAPGAETTAFEEDVRAGTIERTLE